MNIKARVEVSFYDLEVGSVLLQSNASGEDSRFVDLAVFASFVLWQFSTFRVSDPGLGIEDFLSQVDLDLIQKLNQSENPEGIPTLVPHSRGSVRKRFVGKLTGNESVLRLDMDLEGPGHFFKGAGYYAPKSVKLLFRYLCRGRLGDEQWLKSLARIAVACAQAHRTGRVEPTGKVAAEIVAEHWPEKTSAEYPIRRDKWSDVLLRISVGLARARRDFDMECGKIYGPRAELFESINLAAVAYQFGMISPVVQREYVAEEDRQDFADELYDALRPSDSTSEAMFQVYYANYWSGRDEGRQPATRGEKPDWRFARTIVEIANGDLLSGHLKLGVPVCDFESRSWAETFLALGDHAKAQRLRDRDVIK